MMNMEPGEIVCGARCVSHIDDEDDDVDGDDNDDDNVDDDVDDDLERLSVVPDVYATLMAILAPALFFPR